MNPRLLLASSLAVVALSLGLATFAASCGGDVETPGTSASTSGSGASSSGGGCSGTPLACDVCGSSGFECQPNDMCVEGCAGIVCAGCPDGQMGELLYGACSCVCDANGQLNCMPSPNCCQTDMDCGDKKLTPCVSGICKEPVPDGCWSSVECQPGMVCEGASVCPCNYDCLLPDMPGKCVPG